MSQQTSFYPAGIKQMMWRARGDDGGVNFNHPLVEAGGGVVAG
jgi:hypothetical protein